MLVGGAATAQAAAAPSRGDTVSAAVAGRWVVKGPYTESMCIAMRDSYAGDAHCSYSGTDKYYLHICVL